MTKSAALRVAPGAEGVSIWSSELFGDAPAARVREFLARAFSVPEVKRVELRPSAFFGRVSYGSVPDPARVWKQISRALASGYANTNDSGHIDARLLHLDVPHAGRIRVTRIGDSLTTWRVRKQEDNTLRLWHPLVRNRRDVIFRLEDELAGIFGVEAFQANPLTGAVSIRFDSGLVTGERIARELEKAWPRLLDGLDGPPSRKRLLAATGLLGLAFTGQYLVPAVRPFAVGAVALYSAPNVVGAVKQLVRGQVGLPALYSTGLAFMLISGAPFASSVFAVLMQLWPHLGRRKVIAIQRRLYAALRRRPAWARVARADGSEYELSIDELRKGDLVIVRRGEIVPVDGVVTDGHATIADALVVDRLEDRSKGDAVVAGALVSDGSVTIKVERAGAESFAHQIDALLPRLGRVVLPSALEAERIANRNAKPALALAALSLLATRRLRPSQALIRPDYATAPRLSAQLSALHGLAQGLQKGVLFRNPAALDRLAKIELFVFDDSADVAQRGVEVASVQTAEGVSEGRIVAYALAAQRTARSEQSRALSAFAAKRKIVPLQALELTRHAGVHRYRDKKGAAIEVATEPYLVASGVELPAQLDTRTGARARSAATADQPALRPLWVLRDGQVIGQVTFARSGAVLGRQLVKALKAQNERARFILLSKAPDAKAQVLARKLGIELYHAGLSAHAKVELLRGAGTTTLWIGDGSSEDNREAIAASTVSVSLAPLSRAQQDAADILLPVTGAAGLPEVIELGHAQVRRLAQDYSVVYSVNLLGVAGAWLARFGSLQSGLLSNLGTGLVYARHARDLDRLVAAGEAKRNRLLLANNR